MAPPRRVRLSSARGEETGKQLTVGFESPASPLLSRTQERAGARTAPAVVQCRINSPSFPALLRADPALGGAILGEACHFIAYVLACFDSEPVSAPRTRCRRAMPTQSSKTTSPRPSDLPMAPSDLPSHCGQAAVRWRAASRCYAQGVGAIHEDFSVPVSTGAPAPRNRRSGRTRATSRRWPISAREHSQGRCGGGDGARWSPATLALADDELGRACSPVRAMRVVQLVP